MKNLALYVMKQWLTPLVEEETQVFKKMAAYQLIMSL